MEKEIVDGWKPIAAEKIEAVIRDHIAIPKEAKDFITKLRQKYGLPGVIASEGSNNAKEGGDYIPTLAFGIPGGTSTALSKT